MEVRTEEFLEKHVVPFASQWESEQLMPREIFKIAGTYGLTGLIVPTGSGGMGLGVVELSDVLKEIAAVDMACAFSLIVHNNLARSIAVNGSDQLKEMFLPGMLSGERIGGFLLTEPQGGSDAAAITTTATLKGDHYIVTGEKAWVSNGTRADVLSVYAQTEQGMLALIIPANLPGVCRGDKYSLLGGHALGTTGFIFDKVKVPIENVLITQGNGLRAALEGIDLARITVAAMCCGMLEASLHYAIDFAGSRKFKGESVTDLQGNQWRVADIATELAAASALTREAAIAHEGPDSSSVLAAKAKKFATTVALRRIADCMQLMGASGLQQEHPLARHLACAKMAEYLDGTTEIQNVVISRSLF